MSTSHIEIPGVGNFAQFADHDQDIQEWPQLTDILRKLAAPPYDDSDVPGAIGDYPTVWALAGGFDPSLAIFAAISAAATVLDDRIRLEVDQSRGWYESARFWSLSVGPPGSGKTPSQKVMNAPVFELHREEHEAWQRECAAALDGKKDPSGKNDAESKIQQPRLFVSDVTLEKLTDVLRDNEGGVTIFNDELGSIIGSHDQYRSGGSGRDHYEYMRLFDGGPHQVERVNKGTTFIPNWGASILTATTPHALTKMAKKLGDDGLLQRFVIATSKPRVAPIRDANPAEDRDRFHAMIRRLRAYRSHGDYSVVRFAPDAADRFSAFETENISAVEAAYGLIPSLGSHLAKHAAIVARLSLIFHAAITERHPASELVSVSTVNLAIKFARKARHHALAVYSDMAGDTAPLDVARDVARWILADPKWPAVLDRRDVVTRVLSFRKEGPQVRDQAMTLLVDYGWLLPTKAQYDKGYPTRWAINPHLRATFAEQAKREREQRDARRDLLKERTDTKC